jgi:hypothetical protein
MMSCSNNFLIPKAELPPTKNPPLEEPPPPEQSIPNLQPVTDLILTLQNALQVNNHKWEFTKLCDAFFKSLREKQGVELKEKNAIQDAAKIVQQLITIGNLSQDPKLKEALIMAIIIEIKALKAVAGIREAVSESIDYSSNNPDLMQKRRHQEAFEKCFGVLQELLDLDIEPTAAAPQS